ncbi:MAG: hypothetical protein KDD53_01530 [Bdellovibrionales bacterium]|nr:hypothetical protein [Bdellovibrionales bacterium]
MKNDFDKLKYSRGSALLITIVLLSIIGTLVLHSVSKLFLASRAIQNEILNHRAESHLNAAVPNYLKNSSKSDSVEIANHVISYKKGKLISQIVIRQKYSSKTEKLILIDPLFANGIHCSSVPADSWGIDISRFTNESHSAISSKNCFLDRIVATQLQSYFGNVFGSFVADRKLSPQKEIILAATGSVYLDLVKLQAQRLIIVAVGDIKLDFVERDDSSAGELVLISGAGSIILNHASPEDKIFAQAKKDIAVPTSFEPIQNQIPTRVGTTISITKY